MGISMGKLGAIGVILGGLGQAIIAIAGGHPFTSPEVLQGGATVATGIGLLGVRNKQERDNPGT